MTKSADRDATAARPIALPMRLSYRPPLDFAQLLAFIAKRAIPGIESVAIDQYERAVPNPDGSAGWICVRNCGRKPELLLEISGLRPQAIPDAVRRVRRMFDLDADPRAIAAILAQDPLLARALDMHPGLRVPCGWDGFELAVRAVLGQQISVAGATTFARRIVERWGTRLRMPADGPQGLDRAFPTPETLRDAALEEVGLPKARAATLRTLSTAVTEGSLSFAGGQRLEDFVERAVALRGIGPWTAHYIAMRGLAMPDAFPAGDLVLQRRLGAAEGRTRLSESATEARSQRWRPWRAYAVLHLWHLPIETPVCEAA